MSYFVFTSLAFMEFCNDETDLLERLCEAPDNLSVFYQQAFNHLDINIMDLSPVKNISRSQAARYQRAVWKLCCRELGGFPTASTSTANSAAGPSAISTT
jgi:hypothetical protein